MATVTIDDRTLIEALQRGDQHAFRPLYERHRDSIYGYCLRMLRDADLAADASQETFVKMHESIATLSSPQAFRSWLFMIARNMVYTQLRRRPMNGLESAEDVWDSATPHEQLVSQEATQIVQRSLEELHPSYREVLLLREFERMSYEEIAAATGSSRSSVKTRLFKARRALARRLQARYS